MSDSNPYAAPLERPPEGSPAVNLDLLLWVASLGLGIGLPLVGRLSDLGATGVVIVTTIFAFALGLWKPRTIVRCLLSLAGSAALVFYTVNREPGRSDLVWNSLIVFGFLAFWFGGAMIVGVLVGWAVRRKR